MLSISETNSLSLSCKKSLSAGRDKSNRASISIIPSLYKEPSGKPEKGYAGTPNQRPSTTTGTGSQAGKPTHGRGSSNTSFQPETGLLVQSKDNKYRRDDVTQPTLTPGQLIKAEQQETAQRLSLSKRVRACKSGFRCHRKDCPNCFLARCYGFRSDAQQVSEWWEQSQSGITRVVTLAYSARKQKYEDIAWKVNQARRLFFQSRAWRQVHYALTQENCWSPKTGHYPHFHGLLFLEAGTDSNEVQTILQPVWADACKQFGLKTTTKRCLTIGPVQDHKPNQRFSSSLTYTIKSGFADTARALDGDKSTVLNTASILYRAGTGDSGAINAWEDLANAQGAQQVFWSRKIRTYAQEWHDQQDMQRRLFLLNTATCPDCSGPIQSKDEHTSICTDCGLIHQHDHNHHEEELITMPIANEPQDNHNAPLAPLVLTIAHNAPQASSQPHMQPQEQHPMKQQELPPNMLPFKRRTAYKRDLGLFLIDLMERHLTLDISEQNQLEEMKDLIHNNNQDVLRGL